MWMVDYNDKGDIYMVDPFNGPNLRPLAPRPISSATLNCGINGSAISPMPCLSHLHHGCADVFTPNPNHIGMVPEQGNKEFNHHHHHQVLVSSRWNPTPEQLRTLEELYRHGMRTPSADQIQQITVQLRRYGKIEGKNVFYWFQNHKARERQKRRREMESSDHQNTNGGGHREVEIIGRKGTCEWRSSGACNKTLLGVGNEQNGRANKDTNDSNNWAPPPMNCSIPPEEPATSTALQKTMMKDGGEHRPSEQIDHRHLMMINGSGEHQRRRNVIKTWPRMVQHHVLSYPPPPPAHLINTPIMDPKLVNINKSLSNRHLTGFFIAPAAQAPPPPPPYSHLMHEDIFINSHLLATMDEDEDEEDSSQTLQLFPLPSGESYANRKETSDMSVSVINSPATHPHQFFEFLPLKN
ncbi:hypothetical protein SAY87_004301 [Trapa incisa]|uniref:Homeobox domain-containing protein n=1 Tax=Trapa incisa TaxID=236973 RepID=A0AAN7JNP5_9MYRT|nr:hypothetical protein SAY87_004301 [Trapa incisa]